MPKVFGKTSKLLIAVPLVFEVTSILPRKKAAEVVQRVLRAHERLVRAIIGIHDGDRPTIQFYDRWHEQKSGLACARRHLEGVQKLLGLPFC